MSEYPVAVVTGANRGLGLEIARQLGREGWQVIMTARKASEGAAALKTLQDEGLPMELRKLDVTDSRAVASLRNALRDTHGRVDLLVNNAGVMLESRRELGRFSGDPLEVSPQTVMELFNTNTLGALRMIQSLAPLMPQGSRIVNVSSWMGAFTHIEDGWLGYRVSKTALNSLTKVMSYRLEEQGVQVLSVDPGWVRTDMGGPKAELSVEDAAADVVWVATSKRLKASGVFYRKRRRVAW